ncbi:hypothetical protein MTR_7g032505 [Medicago truncatula]|uniref:Endonuclease/exonuclease/phosphatase family protein n=1 Tax=Medicago truncatula TaxID=3880 RepID=A0A072U8A2_MEDTR|nr:hypothetical protein MTR_7g032505 [Medicago truncatula]
MECLVTLIAIGQAQACKNFRRPGSGLSKPGLAWPIPNPTWRSGRSGTRNTERRLDRCICNQRWMDFVSSVNCSTLIRNQSDHYPILLYFQLTNHKFSSQFKFLKMWSLHENCKEVIQDSWSLPVIGCPMFVLSKKLQTLEIRLKCWNKEVFGNIHDLVKTTEASLQTVQAQIQTLGRIELLVQEEKQAQHDLDLALNKEELFWLEKFKDHALVEDAIPEMITVEVNRT